MNRPLCVDPAYVSKLREGRIDEIAPCTRCLHCFYDPDKAGTLMEHCRVNAANWRAYGEAMPEGLDAHAGPWTPRRTSWSSAAAPPAWRRPAWRPQRGRTVTLYEKSEHASAAQLTAGRGRQGPAREPEPPGHLPVQGSSRCSGVEVQTDTEVDGRRHHCRRRLPTMWCWPAAPRTPGSCLSRPPQARRSLHFNGHDVR